MKNLIRKNLQAFSLSELLRNVARAARSESECERGENIQVTYNFGRAKVTEIIHFLCREYNLDLDIVGDIVAIYPVAALTPIPQGNRYLINRNA